MTFEIFLVVPPGLEKTAAEEARSAAFEVSGTVPGGVTLLGGWPEVWRANLTLRGPTRVLARVGSFRAFHLAQLDKRAHKFDWAALLRPDVAVRVEVSTKRSKIYHAGAAAERIERAISDTAGAPIATDAPVRILARIDDNLVTLSIDTSGAPLYKRGHKQFSGKAPIRETLAALFLRAAGFDGAEPVVDPMCGSGTFVIEAAEIAAGLMPGRGRGFAFEDLAGFDREAFGAIATGAVRPPGSRFFGFDRDAGAVTGAAGNAQRAGVGAFTRFAQGPISELQRPEGPPGLVIANPPYGGRIGNRKLLFALYGSLGAVLKERFGGWRVAIVTNDGGLAKATGLPFEPPGPPVDHGGLKVRLWQTRALPKTGG